MYVCYVSELPFILRESAAYRWSLLKGSLMVYRFIVQRIWAQLIQGTTHHK